MGTISDYAHTGKIEMINKNDYFTGDLSNRNTENSMVQHIEDRMAELSKSNDGLRLQLMTILKKQKYEELLRNEHKGLQNAWEQYQIMLKLVQGNK